MTDLKATTKYDKEVLKKWGNVSLSSGICTTKCVRCRCENKWNVFVCERGELSVALKLNRKDRKNDNRNARLDTTKNTYMHTFRRRGSI